MLDVWWVWIAVAVAFAGLEVMLRWSVFLGVALGATATGALLASGNPLADFVTQQTGTLLVVFAIASILGLALVRAVPRRRRPRGRGTDRASNDD